MSNEWGEHRGELTRAFRAMMRCRTTDQLRDIAINDCNPSKRVAAIEELARRLRA